MQMYQSNSQLPFVIYLEQLVVINRPCFLLLLTDDATHLAKFIDLLFVSNVFVMSISRPNNQLFTLLSFD